MKDIDDFNDIPEWDFNKYRDEDDEGEDWKTQPKIERVKLLYNQGRQIYSCSKIFCESLKGEMAEMSQSLIMQNAMMICPKIVGAEGGNLYIIRMENASIIRTNCRELETQVRATVMFETGNEAYSEILLNEIEIFKTYFIEWVSYFEKDDIDDEWGLYN